MNTRILFALLALPALGAVAWAQIRPGGPPTTRPAQMLRYESVIYETEMFKVYRALDRAPHGILYPGMSPDRIFIQNDQQRHFGLESIQTKIRTRGRDGWRLHSLNKLSEDGGYDQIMLIFERGKPMP